MLPGARHYPLATLCGSTASPSRAGPVWAPFSQDPKIFPQSWFLFNSLEVGAQSGPFLPDATFQDRQASGAQAASSGHPPGLTALSRHCFWTPVATALWLLETMPRERT